MKINAYSERGMINSLVYETKIQNSVDIVINMFNQAVFPYNIEMKLNLLKNQDTDFYVEQGLSGFGSADLIVKLNAEKKLIFVEAKVLNASGKGFSIEKQLKIFCDMINKKETKPRNGFSSNLFTQLYLKYKLIKEFNPAKRTGVAFKEMPCLTYVSPEEQSEETGKDKKRKLGKNIVVVKAAKNIRKDIRTDDTYFMAIIPNKYPRAKNTSGYTLLNKNFAQCWEWPKINSNDPDIQEFFSRFCFITWENIRIFERNRKGKSMILKNFEFNQVSNKSQIYWLGE